MAKKNIEVSVATRSLQQSAEWAPAVRIHDSGMSLQPQRIRTQAQTTVIRCGCSVQTSRTGSLNATTAAAFNLSCRISEHLMGLCYRTGVEVCTAGIRSSRSRAFQNDPALCSRHVRKARRRWRPLSWKAPASRRQQELSTRLALLKDISKLLQRRCSCWRTLVCDFLQSWMRFPQRAACASLQSVLARTFVHVQACLAATVPEQENLLPAASGPERLVCGRMTGSNRAYRNRMICCVTSQKCGSDCSLRCQWCLQSARTARSCIDRQWKSLSRSGAGDSHCSL